MKLDLVYNPASGGFRQERMERLAEAFEQGGASVTAVPTSRDGIAFSADAELICVHGGDGALRDTVNALGPRIAEVPLCIAPSGTINLVARELGYPAQPSKLAAMVLAGWERGRENWLVSPAYRFNDTPIVSCGSVGPDSHAVAGVSAALKARIGRYAYIAALMKNFVNWPRQDIAIEGELADGTPFACEAEAFIISHGALYAGPFRLSAEAGLTRDSVELITLRRSTRLGTLALSSAAVMRLPIGKLGLAEIRTVRRAKITGDPAPVQIDGDDLETLPGSITPSGFAVTYCL